MQPAKDTKIGSLDNLRTMSKRLYHGEGDLYMKKARLLDADDKVHIVHFAERVEVEKNDHERRGAWPESDC